MRRPHRFTVLCAIAALVLLAVAAFLRSWGGVALVAVAAGAFAWYRVQVAQGEAAQQFFGDLGEETRLTAFQGGSPSEMAVDPPAPADRPPGRAPNA